MVEGWRSRKFRVGETRWWLPRRVRVTAALIRILGDISDTHNCCCTVAAVAAARGAPPSDAHEQQRRKAKSYFFMFVHETSPLEERPFFT